MSGPGQQRGKRQDEGFWRKFWWNGGFVLVPFIVLLAVSAAIGAGVVRDRMIQSDWQLVRGVVTSASVEGCGKSGHTVRARYRYSVDSFDYAGEARAAGTRKCDKKALVEQLAVQTVGTPADVYFDPSNPSDAVLGQPVVRTGRYVVLAICAALIAAFIGLFAHALLSSPVRNRDLTPGDISHDAARSSGKAHHARPFKPEPPGNL